jgi:hypothetical protein
LIFHFPDSRIYGKALEQPRSGGVVEAGRLDAIDTWAK